MTASPELPARARCWCVCDDQLLLNAEGGPLTLESPGTYRHRVQQCLPVGEWPTGNGDHYPLYVLILDGQQPQEQWSGLRAMLGRISDNFFALAGRALQLAHWADTLRYCHRCGSPLGAVEPEALRHGDYVKSCRQCQHHSYPIIAPCVIGLVTRGRQCLLAHHQRARQPVFTALAGFINPGETAEQAFEREVLEEVALTVEAPVYAGSQSWPFPGQLMLGFYAEYRGGEIQPDRREIAEANWYDCDNLPAIPPVGTIARRLIDGFTLRCRQECPEDTR